MSHADGSTHRFEGDARFEADGLRRLAQIEEGVLTGLGPPMKATRRYFWTEADGILQVTFEDGRAFHEVALGDVRPTARHFCDPDVYAVVYDFSLKDRWSAEWRVEGPRKD